MTKSRFIIRRRKKHRQAQRAQNAAAQTRKFGPQLTGEPERTNHEIRWAA